MVEHLVQQLDLQPDVFIKYALREETRYNHRRTITDYLGYKEFDDFQVFRLTRWIYAHLAVSVMRPSVLIARVRERYTARTFEGLSKKLSATQRKALEDLLVLPVGKWQTPLEVLRTPLSRVGAISLYQALHRMEVIYPVVPINVLDDLIKEAASGNFEQQVRLVTRNSYGRHYRRAVPLLLKALHFCCNNDAYRPIMQALELLEKYRESKSPTFPVKEIVPLAGVVKDGWHDLVIDEKDKVNRIAYEICVLSSLRDKIRCKEIWIQGAGRFQNPDDDLPHDFRTAAGRVLLRFRSALRCSEIYRYAPQSHRSSARSAEYRSADQSEG